MPSGNVFKLSGSGGFNLGPDDKPITLLGGKGYVDLLLNAEAECSLEHGINIALGHRFEQNTQLDLQALILAGNAEGKATAEAGIAGRVYFPLNIFDKVGFVAEVQAVAEASAAGRIACSLEKDELVNLARSQLGLRGLSVELFREFIKIADIEAGVWGSVNAGVAAEAFLKLYGTLKNERDAGFVFETGAQAAFGYGAGYQIFGGIALRDPRAFYTFAIRRILKEVLSQAQSALPERKVALYMLDFLASLGLKGAYDLGQLPDSSVSSDANIRRTLNRIAVEELQQFVLQEICRYNIKGLQELTDQTSVLAEGQLASVLGGLNELSIEDIDTELLSDIFELVAQTATDSQLLNRWRKALSILWTVQALIDTAQNPPAMLAGAVDIGSLIHKEHEAKASYLAAAPEFVVPELAASGMPISPDGKVSVQTAITYLLQPVHIQSFTTNDSHLVAFLQPLADKLHSGTTQANRLNNLLHNVLFNPEYDLGAANLYSAIRDYSKEIFAEHLLAGHFTNVIRNSLSKHDEARQFYDDVILPALFAVNEFVFSHVDQMLNNSTKLNWTEFSSFQSGLSLLVMQILGQHVAMAATLTMLDAIENLDEGFDLLAAEIRDGSQLASAIRNELDLPNTGFTEEIRAFVGDVAALGGTLFGPRVWTRQRRKQLALLTQQLICFEIDQRHNESLHTKVGWQNLANRLDDTDFVPSQKAVRELGELFAETMQQNLTTLSQEAVRLGQRYAKLFVGRALDEALDAVEDILRELHDKIARLQEQIDALEATVQKQLRQKSKRVRAIADRLFNDSAQQRMLQKIEQQGREAFADAAERLAEKAPQLLSTNRRNVAIGVARGIAKKSFSRSFLPVKMIINLLLDSLGDFYQVVEEAVDQSESLDNAKRQIARTVRARIAQQLTIELPDGLSRSGVLDILTSTALEQSQFGQNLQQAMDARSAVSEAEDKRESHRRQLRRKQREAAAVEANGQENAIRCGIIQPRPIHQSGQPPCIYGRHATAEIFIENVNRSFMDDKRPRICIKLNGYDLNLAHVETDYSWLRKTLTVERAIGTRPGRNHLAVAVATLQGRIIHRSRIFFADHSASASHIVHGIPQSANPLQKLKNKIVHSS